MPTQAQRQTTGHQHYHGRCPTSNDTEQGKDDRMGRTGRHKKSSSGMGDKSQRNQHQADAAGVNLRYTGDEKHGRGGPNLGSSRGLPHHTHNEQALELGASVSASDGSTVAGTTQNYPDPVYGNQPRAYNHRPPKSSHQSPIRALPIAMSDTSTKTWNGCDQSGTCTTEACVNITLRER